MWFRYALVLCPLVVIAACSGTSSSSSGGGTDPSTTTDDGGGAVDGGTSVAQSDAANDAASPVTADPKRACDVPLTRAFTCREGATVSTGASPPPDGIYDRIAIGSAPPPAGTSCESSIQFDRGTYQWAFFDIIDSRGGGKLVRDDAKGTLEFIEMCKNEYGVGNWKYSFQYDPKTERLSIENESRAWVYERRKP